MMNQPTMHTATYAFQPPGRSAVLAEHLRQGQRAVGTVAILYAVSGVLQAMLTPEDAVFTLLLSGVFVAFQIAFWGVAKSGRVVLGATLSLALFATLHGYVAYLGGLGTLREGLLIKLVVLSILIDAIRRGDKLPPHMDAEAASYAAP